ncbi:MAG: 4-carboxymuconolactone decarboxylase [Deltaproteobacteria bacterium]|nr:4-carboxymuconolactone decarboxylase [Deltaproteobacteria bacterium]
MTDPDENAKAASEKEAEQDANDQSYYVPNDINRFGDVGKDAHDTKKKIFEYYGAVFEKGALSQREKALTGLAVAHAVQCPYCIDAYSSSSLEKGASPAQMTETIHVACAVRGGASLVHGVQLNNHIDKLTM